MWDEGGSFDEQKKERERNSDRERERRNSDRKRGKKRCNFFQIKKVMPQV